MSHRISKTPMTHTISISFLFYRDALCSQAAEGQGLRFQMACGTGKTFTYALIISRIVACRNIGLHVM